MAETEKPIRADAGGFDAITNVMRELLNQYPGKAEEIKYEELRETSGIAFFADAGALVMSEKVSITDHVRQNCQYPMNIVFRTISTRERQKLMARNFLDDIGKWLCRETVVIGGAQHCLTGYPKLTDGRKITRISRDNAFGAQPTDKDVQDWVLPVKVEYTHEFDM